MGKHLLEASKEVLGAFTKPFKILGQAVLARQIDVSSVKVAFMEAFGPNGGKTLGAKFIKFINSIKHECKSSK